MINDKIKTTIRKLAITTILTGIAVVCLYLLRDFTFIYMTISTNIVLYILAFYTGVYYGFIPAIVVPIATYFICPDNLIQTAPIVLSGLVLGNICMVIVTALAKKWLVELEYVNNDGKLLNDIKLNLGSGFFASLSKALVMSIMIVFIFLNMNKDKLDNIVVYDKARVNYSISQFAAAIIAIAIIGLVFPTVKAIYFFLTIPAEDDANGGVDKLEDANDTNDEA